MAVSGHVAVIRSGDEAVSTSDDSNPEFEDLNLDDFGMPADGLPDPTALGDDFPAEPLEEAPVEEGKSKKKAKKERKKKEPKPKAVKQPKEPKVKKPSSGRPGLVAAMTQASPFTILLAIAFLALLIAVYCMAMQLWQYGGDYGATKAKQQASLPAVLQSVEMDQARVV
ncbi:MAG TPA: hypothetical protein DD670_06595 [Planctomycetaceae bacterium]|nr:hypothetical protein [Planctomycetaceae bacterium]